MSVRAARETLGLGALYSAADLRRAFRDAAKQAHPDREGGDEAQFRRVMEAYHRLQGLKTAAADRIVQPPAARAPDPPPAARPGILVIDPLIALSGGVVEHQMADGRRVRATLPPGLREADRVRIASRELTVEIASTADLLVRGDDLWVNAEIDPKTLAQGGRVAVETPVGRRIVWLTPRATARKLVRLVGQGLPPRGRHIQGDLFLRLAPARGGQADSAARNLLRKFAAAWAA